MLGLVNVTKTETNLLRSPGFGQYVRSPRWQDLKQLIYSYDMKFRGQLNIGPFTNKNSDSQSELGQVIRDMKYEVPQNMKVLEYLVYYYQIK